LKIQDLDIQDVASQILIIIQDWEIEDLAYIEKLRFGNSRVSLSNIKNLRFGLANFKKS